MHVKHLAESLVHKQGSKKMVAIIFLIQYCKYILHQVLYHIFLGVTNRICLRGEPRPSAPGLC